MNSRQRKQARREHTRQWPDAVVMKGILAECDPWLKTKCKSWEWKARWEFRSQPGSNIDSYRRVIYFKNPRAALMFRLTFSHEILC